MKKLVLILIAVLMVGAFAWPVSSVSAAAKTVTIKITETEINSSATDVTAFGPVNKIYADVQEGQLVYSMTVKQQNTGKPARVILYTKVNVVKGLMNWYITRATVNGKAIPASALKTANSLFTTNMRAAFTPYTSKYPGYKLTSVKLTRNTIVITLTASQGSKV